MCRRVTCEKCSKPTFAGCGAHVEMVLGDVPKDQRCKCREAVSTSGPSVDASSKPKWWPFGS